MKKQLFITGIVLTIIGIVFIPIAILTPMTRTYPTEDLETVIRYDKTTVPYPVQANLQSGNKYRLYIDTQSGSNPRIEIEDPNGVTILLTTEYTWSLDFNTQSSGIYKIWVSGYYKTTTGYEPIDTLSVSKVLEKTVTYYVESPFSYLAIFLIIAGVGLSISSRLFFRK